MGAATTVTVIHTLLTFSFPIREDLGVFISVPSDRSVKPFNKCAESTAIAWKVKRKPESQKSSLVSEENVNKVLTPRLF